MGFRNFAAGFLVILVFGQGCAIQSFQQASTPDSNPFQHAVIGLCEDYPEETRSLEAARHDLLLLQTNHIRILRVAFGWDAIEAEPGQYDWSFWDDFMGMAAECGVTLIPYVCYTPRWNSAGNDENFWRQPPKDNLRFAQFVKQAVARYKNKIHSWEIWNEPDNRAYWEGSVEQFAELLKAGSRAVHEIDPGAKVVSGGIAWDLNFLKELFAKHGVSPFVDVVNLHCYFETWSEEPLENIGDYVLRANRILEQHGNHQPIWLAEVGYSSFRHGKFVSDVYNAKFDFEHTRQYQAESVVRAVASALATGKVRLVAWYRIHDLRETEDIIGDVNNRYLGIVDVNGKMKLALNTLAFVNSLFSGEIRSLNASIRACRTICTESEVHVFEKRGGDLIITAWLKAVPLNNCEHHQQQTDRHSEILSLDLPRRVSNYAQLYDETGRRRSEFSLRKVHGSNRVTLGLKGGKMNILLMRPGERTHRR